jgi:hypothetical protein
MEEKTSAPETKTDETPETEDSRREMIGKVFSALGAVTVGGLIASTGEAAQQMPPQAMPQQAMPVPAGVALRSEKLQSGGFALSLGGRDIATALAREGLNSKLGERSSVTLTWA